MFRGIRDTQGKKSDLPITSSNFKPKAQSVPRRQILKYACYIIGAFLFIYLLSSKGNISIKYSDEENFTYRFKNIDYEKLKKYDDGVEQFLVDKDGVKLQGSTERVIQKDIDELYHSTVDYYDLSDAEGSSNGAIDGDYILLLIPLRNAEPVLPLMFKHIMNLTYPHSLIDIAFLVSDCSKDDRTLESLFDLSVALQNGNLSDLLKAQESIKGDLSGTSDLHLGYMDPDYIEKVDKAFNPPFHKDYNEPFNSVQIFKKDFGQIIGQGFTDRHDVKVQGIRRKLMGKARNWLTSNALKPYHSWVYWRDADIELMPGSIIQDLMKFNYDVIVPNVWRPLPEFLGNEQAYDLNSWIESDQGLELARNLQEDDVIVEGYAEYPTWRVHLGYIRNPNGDPNEIVDMDGVGGVSILAKAKVFRRGVHFPAFTFQNHAETEAFGKMAKTMGFRVGGLPHYTVWHIYEPSEDDLQEIARKERKKRRQNEGKEDLSEQTKKKLQQKE
ncbi:Mannan polymerase I complex VAN1 subunit [Wickerhamomyces ciferrii]|uniref:Mannan polymerase I complex VAN1 subunit n=1 Tax=Wickerhamomyces ciferrii (strain ATCC 14091 / BCRC 22168 / CBS 111 / JCM 3599 / NBRC 0793 / NRRL Y-1031 F-60-10) TaxID=1206466 RepID=K0KZ34_WICCF|nr:Mannan polymerase I complex VAN1 subunit [Wickerhamomyces ciferrii]CCH46358.1 Mannan polymerase I complex VAN1 subunit [Wickerhamomyces ciferrii]